MKVKNVFKYSVLAISALASIAFMPQRVQADDTELFTTPPGTIVPAPNVLFILDNSSNWTANNQNWPGGGTQGASELKAIKEILGYVSSRQVNVGLMMHSGGGGVVGGGYMRFGVRPVNEEGNDAKLTSIIDGILTGGNLNSQGENINQASKDSAAAFYEAHQYFSSAQSYATPYKYSDFSGNSQTKTTQWAGFSKGFAYPSSSGGIYNGPLRTDIPCAKNYIIYIGNAGNNIGSAGAKKYGSGANEVVVGDPITLADSGAQAYWMDEWAKYLYETGVKTPSEDVNGAVVTYTIDVYNAAQNLQQTALLQSAARNGGGRYFAATSESQITDAIKSIFEEIQAVNSVFASVTLPVSVNLRGTNLNQVYLGMFRPDAQALPSWPGNLKQYQLALDANNALYLADANKQDAIGTTGFFQGAAVSFWSSANNYWSFAPSAEVSNSVSDTPDGPLVERGGSAQATRWKINQSGCDSANTDAAVNACKRQASDRVVYTQVGVFSSGSTPQSFNTSNANITVGALGATDATERDNIINWTRGADLYDEDGRGDTADLRADFHGDVIHSKPAVVNYNRYGDDNDIIVFYGSNDGALRAVQGGQAKSPGNSRKDGGQEYWSFVSEEFFSKLKRQYDNSPKISWTGEGDDAVSNTTHTVRLYNGSPVGVIYPFADNGLGVGVGVAVAAPSGIAANTSLSSYGSDYVVELDKNNTDNLAGGVVYYQVGTLSGSTYLGSTSASATGTMPAWLTSGLLVTGSGVASGTTLESVTAATTIDLSENAVGTQNPGVLELHLPSDGDVLMAAGESRLIKIGGNFGSKIPAGVDVRYGTAGALATGTQTTGTVVPLDNVSLSSAATVNGIVDAIVSSPVTVNATSELVKIRTTNVASNTCAAGSASCVLTINTAQTKNDSAIAWGDLYFTVSGIYYKVLGAPTGSSITVAECANSSCTATKVTGAARNLRNLNTINVFYTNDSDNVKLALKNGSSTGVLISRNKTWSSGNLTIGGAAAGTITMLGTKSESVGLTQPVVSTTVSSSVNPIEWFVKTDAASFTLGSKTVGVPATFTPSVAKLTDAGNAISVISAKGSTAIATGSKLGALPTGGLTLGLSAAATGTSSGTLSFWGQISATLYKDTKVMVIDQTEKDKVPPNTLLMGSGIASGAKVSTLLGESTILRFNKNATVTGSVLVTFTKTLIGSNARAKPYFFDGPVTVWRFDAPGAGTGSTATTGDGKIIAGSCSSSGECDKVIMYAPMRRGGKSIYAFDVTDPATPKLLWKIKGGTGGTVGFEELGYTWSAPNPTKMEIDGKVIPVLVFGGGYDPDVEDIDPPLDNSGKRLSNTMGRAVYFVNGNTGKLIKVFKGSASAALGSSSTTMESTAAMTSAQSSGAADMNCAIPSDVAVLKMSESTGFEVPAYRAYVGDTCGQVWRFDVYDEDPDNWIVTKFASVGAAHYGSSAGGSLTGDALAQQNRKFLFPPDIVFGGLDTTGRKFDYVMIGAGDREHPYNGYGDVLHPVEQAAQNRFYMFKDYYTGTGYTQNGNTLIQEKESGGTGYLKVSEIIWNGSKVFNGDLPYTEKALYDTTANDIQLASATESAKAIAADAFGAYHGWYITLDQAEKVVGGATTAAGTVFFGTNIPTPNGAACGVNLGEARMYQINITNGAAVPPDTNTLITSNTARYSKIIGGGLPPTPVPVAVLIDGKFVEGVLAGTKVEQPKNTLIGTRVRIYSKKVVDKATFK